MALDSYQCSQQKSLLNAHCHLIFSPWVVLIFYTSRLASGAKLIPEVVDIVLNSLTFLDKWNLTPLITPLALLIPLAQVVSLGIWGNTHHHSPHMKLSINPSPYPLYVLYTFDIKTPHSVFTLLGFSSPQYHTTGRSFIWQWVFL